MASMFSGRSLSNSSLSLASHISAPFGYILPEKEDLIKIGMTLEESELFTRVFDKYLKTTHGAPYMDWDHVKPIPDPLHYDQLPEVDQKEVGALLNKIVVVKLNGGLGTRMGCIGPKCMIEVRNDMTFLDIAVRQVEHLNKAFNVDIPLALMNSFHTDKPTRKLIQKYNKNRISIYTFKQSRLPRLYKDTLRPLPKPIGKKDKEEDMKHWYPPGSGDVFRSLLRSGLAEQFLKAGKEYLFISNIENLGGLIDLKLLQSVVRNKEDFVLEVTDRHVTDVTGSILVSELGHTRLLETSQIPASLHDTFSAAEYRYWNTNNMWISIASLQKAIREDTLDLSFVVNVREVDGVNVLQLECPAGSLIQTFPTGKAIEVPRRRMRNVKGTASLFPLQSNLFDMREDGQLVMSPLRAFPSVPIIKFGEHFYSMSEYVKRFQEVPDILELDRLTVAGDVTFGAGVSLKGTVVIVANPGEKIDIPSGCTLENKIVTGSLRILDH